MPTQFNLGGESLTVVPNPTGDKWHASTRRAGSGGHWVAVGTDDRPIEYATEADARNAIENELSAEDFILEGNPAGGDRLKVNQRLNNSGRILAIRETEHVRTGEPVYTIEVLNPNEPIDFESIATVDTLEEVREWSERMVQWDADGYWRPVGESPLGNEYGKALQGNPGEGTLHGMLSDVADHVDYEASVVETAADEIEDDDIREAAEEQAEAMADAADALDEAAEAAADTAAEIFTETGTAQDDPQADPALEEVRDGNPTPDQMAGEFVLPFVVVDTEFGGLVASFNTRAEAEAFARLLSRERGRGMRVSELVDGVLQNHEVIEGNPGESPLPTTETEPVPDSGHVELVPEPTVPAAPDPTPTPADTPPVESHWYTRPLGGKK